MVKRGLVVLFLVMFCLSFVSALDTQIDVKTKPYHDVYLTVLEPATEGYTALKIFKNSSDGYGDISFIYSSDTVSAFDLMVVVKSGDARVFRDEFRESYSAGTLIYLEAAPTGFELLETPELEEVVSETEEVLTDETETNETEESENVFGIAGNAIYDKGKQLFSNSTSYYVIAIIALVVFIFIVNKKGYVKFNFNGGSGGVVKKEDDGKKKKVDQLKQKMVETQKELMKLRSED